MKRKGLLQKVHILLILLAMLASFVAPKAVLAAEAAEVSLRVDLSYSGGSAPEESFTVLVVPQENAADPMEGNSQSKALSLHQPEGSITFTFSFDAEGTYVYQIKEQAGETEGVTYDQTSYTVTFEVYEEEVALKSIMRVAKDGEDAEKPDAIAFANTYTESEPDQPKPNDGKKDDQNSDNGKDDGKKDDSDSYDDGDKNKGGTDGGTGKMNTPSSPDKPDTTTTTGKTTAPVKTGDASRLGIYSLLLGVSLILLLGLFLAKRRNHA